MVFTVTKRDFQSQNENSCAEQNNEIFNLSQEYNSCHKKELMSHEEDSCHMIGNPITASEKLIHRNKISP